MKYLFALFFIWCVNITYSQTRFSFNLQNNSSTNSNFLKKQIADAEYPKWFFDVTGIGIRGSKYSFLSNIEGVPSEGKYFDNGFGGKFGIGNHFYINKTRQNLFVRVSWLQLGFVYYDGLALVAGLAHPSVGYNFKVTNKFSIQPAIGGGLVVLMPVLNDLERIVALFPEIRFCLRKIDFGLQYSRYVDKDYPQIDDSPTYDYTSFSIFFKF